MAKRFTSSPLIAALATLVAPGFLVSATGVMCDVMMLAFWIWAVVFWIEGMDSSKSPFFALSGVLIAACALTKYFGACVMLLLAVYSLFKWRRVDVRIVYLLIPVAVLVWYQLGTRSLYGRGLLWDAAQYARSPEHVDESSRLISGLVGLSFLGGCSLPVLLFAPFLWTRRVRVLAIGAAALAGLAVGMRWMNPLIHDPNQHWAWIGVQFTLYSAGGLFVLALAFADYRKCRDAESLLLALWVLGTFFFEAFVNWTVNARSVLPLIPAAAILLARRLDDTSVASSSGALVKLAVPLTLSTAVSLAIAWGDTAFANSGRAMAGFIHRQSQNQRVFFEGHWAFQHYMQPFGARPVEADKLAFETGDIVVTPENTTNTFPLGPHLVAAQELLQINPHARTATMALGAGFYSSAWGPLPFGFGRAPVERYLVVHVK